MRSSIRPIAATPVAMPKRVMELSNQCRGYSRDSKRTIKKMTAAVTTTQERISSFQYSSTTTGQKRGPVSFHGNINQDDAAKKARQEAV